MKTNAKNGLMRWVGRINARVTYGGLDTRNAHEYMRPIIGCGGNDDLMGEAANDAWFNVTARFF